MDGRFSIDDAIELGWPIEDSEEFETIAGFVLDQADSLPEPGEVITMDGYKFRVQSVRGRRIAMLRVTAPEQVSDEDKSEGSDASDKDHLGDEESSSDSGKTKRSHHGSDKDA